MEAYFETPTRKIVNAHMRSSERWLWVSVALLLTGTLLGLFTTATSLPAPVLWSSAVVSLVLAWCCKFLETLYLRKALSFFPPERPTT